MITHKNPDVKTNTCTLDLKLHSNPNLISCFGLCCLEMRTIYLYKRNVITHSIARTVGFDMQMFSAAAHAERGACGAQDLGSAIHYSVFETEHSFFSPFVIEK